MVLRVTPILMYHFILDILTCFPSPCTFLRRCHFNSPRQAADWALKFMSICRHARGLKWWLQRRNTNSKKTSRYTTNEKINEDRNDFDLSCINICPNSAFPTVRGLPSTIIHRSLQSEPLIVKKNDSVLAS